MEKFDRSTKTGDIVIIVPQASSILKRYRIDFCCGGNRPIGEIFDEKNLNGDEILEEVNALYAQIQSTGQTEKDWTQASYEELVDQIVNVHHAYLYKELPEISPYVTKIMRVHGAHHPELIQLHELFHKVKTELEQHTAKEESTDFPAILEYAKDPSPERLEALRKAIGDLESEHDNAGRILEKMREITNDYTPPADACMTYQLTFKKLIELEGETFQHIHLENNILFRRALSGETTTV